MRLRLSLMHALVRKLKGPYQVIASEFPMSESLSLLRVENNKFHFNLRYRGNAYLWRYRRWYVPDERRCVLLVEATVTEGAPENLKKACSYPILIPNVSAKLPLSRKERERVRILSIDILHTRLRQIVAK